MLLPSAALRLPLSQSQGPDWRRKQSPFKLLKGIIVKFPLRLIAEALPRPAATPHPTHMHSLSLPLHFLLLPLRRLTHSIFFHVHDDALLHL